MNEQAITSEMLRLWEDALERARSSGLKEPTAAALATVQSDGFPDVRIVLIRGWDPSGFCFYSNYESAKATQMAQQQGAALCVFWDTIHEQVRIRGRVQPVTPQESDAYWKTRPRGSQIGAWASQQSRPMTAAEELTRRVAEFERRFGETEPPRPEFWGGYRLRPHAIEFWQGRPSRLHERRLFEWEDGQWTEKRLFP